MRRPRMNVGLFGYILITFIFGGSYTTNGSTSSSVFLCEENIDFAKELSVPISNFAGRLFALLVQENPKENVVFSPVSIMVALALIERGAQSGTRSEILKTLADHTMDDLNDISPSYQALQHHLEVRNAKSANLSMANGFFYRKGHKIKQKYENVIKKCFETEILELPSRADQAVKMINAFVSNRTSKSIPDLLKPGMIDEQTSAILINAVHLKASWEKPFRRIETRKFYAHNEKKSPQIVPFATNVEYYRYYCVGDYEVVDLPYLGNEFTMVVAMRSLGSLQNADSVLFSSRASFQREGELLRLDLKIPKFFARWSMDLKAILFKLGIKKMFSEKANLSRMSDDDFHVTNAVHETHIKVDENGTEATSATALELGYKSKPAKPILFVLDRPFTYTIIHNPTGATVFMGKVNYIEDSKE